MLFLLLLIILGGIVAFFTQLSQKKYYETHITVTTAVVPNIIISRITNNIDSIINSGNLQALSGILSIKPDEAKKIKKINATEVYQIDTTTKSIINLQHINICIQVYDSALTTNIKNKLLEYINNNPYITRRFSLYKKEYDELLSKINQERFKLSYSKEDSSLFYLNHIGPHPKLIKLLPDEFIHLLEDKIDFEKGLELIDPIEIIDEFTIGVVPKVSYFQYIKYSLIIGILALLLFELIKNPLFKPKD